jgi:hypothetical protein
MKAVASVAIVSARSAARRLQGSVSRWTSSGRLGFFRLTAVVATLSSALPARPDWRRRTTSADVHWPTA